jgi:hypothetical protein
MAHVSAATGRRRVPRHNPARPVKRGSRTATASLRLRDRAERRARRVHLARPEDRTARASLWSHLRCKRHDRRRQRRRCRQGRPRQGRPRHGRRLLSCKRRRSSNRPAYSSRLAPRAACFLCRPCRAVSPIWHRRQYRWLRAHRLQPTLRRTSPPTTRGEMSWAS